MTTRHPELAAEQQYVHRSHDCHERAIAQQRETLAGGNAGSDKLAQRSVRELALKRLAQLEAADTSRLVVGRLDFEDPKKGTIYVGPITVLDGGKVVVVDWTRPIVKGFYYATASDPFGLVRRRSFDLYGRELRDITDEVFGELPSEVGDVSDQPVGSEHTVLDRVAADLERAREPHMRDIVASIVADQYRMIEAPHEGVFIVQGGPGTGKTAVALHRAVFLLRNNQDLGKVLVVGPNAAFMAYIANVLPGLGETSVHQRSVGRLATTGEAEARGEDTRSLAALKGDARMADVIKRSLRLRVREAHGPYSVRVQSVTAQMTADEANAILTRELAEDRPYMEGRRRFVDVMRATMEGALQQRMARSLRRRSLDRDALQRQLNNDREWANLLERMWPTVSAAQAIHDLLTIEQRLRAAADGLLDESEITALRRRDIRTVGVHPWTSSDMALIDEAQALIQGRGDTYGYVIVDEAQDLTPMQLRMVARHSANGDLTLVGDIAQATGPWRYAGWDELVEHLPRQRGVRHDELVIGYRVPRSIMELANLLLPLIAPGLTPTTPVREARVDPRFEKAEPGRLAESVARAVVDLINDDRSVGIIAANTNLVEVRGALAGMGVSFGNIATDQMDKRVTLLSSAESKGLEFDRVVVVEPMAIVTGSSAGWSELYVALSRSTQELVVVHAEPLPAPLPGGIPVPTADEVIEVVEMPVEAGPPGNDQDLDLDLDLDLDMAVDMGVAAASEAPPLGETSEAVVASTPVIDAALPEPDQPVLPIEAEAPAMPLASHVEETDASPVVSPPAAATRSTTPRLGGDFSDALILAKLTHDGRARRGTAVPYMGHLLGTVALVLEDGGSETEAIAALLHDAVEDSTPEMAETIRRRFGDTVAEIVLGCTDPVMPGSFHDVKVKHFQRLEQGSSSVRRVALAEKLDNANALLRDLERYGSDVWKRMEVDQAELLWYLHNLVALFQRTFPSVLATELERAVIQIEALTREG